MNPEPVSFENTETAFASLSDKALRKANLLFSLFNSPFLVAVGSAVTEASLKLHLPVKGLVKTLVYDHFCGGEELPDIKPVIDKLAEKNIGVLLNYGVEAKRSEKDYDESVRQNLMAIEYAGKERGIKAICIKITGFGRLELFEKIQRKETLNPAEEIEWKAVNERFDKLCARALDLHVSLYIDAEESWIQDPLDEMVIERMQRFNKTEAIIFNTYQLYRSDKLKHLMRDHALAEKEGFVLGAKLVRGAYVDKENEYAARHGLRSPVHVSKAATDKDFDEALQYCVDHIDTISFCIASHNEESCLLLTRLLKQASIPFSHPHVSVSQLYGMGDHITFNMASTGIPCTKYLPYGPVKEVIPYLIRRAQENGSVEGQMGRELRLVRTELKRRGL